MPETPRSRNCSGCGKQVAHKEYRRNRYGEYVCGDCVRKGFRFSKGRTFRRLARRALTVGWQLAVRVGIAVLLLAGFYFVMNRLTDPPAPATEALLP